MVDTPLDAINNPFAPHSTELPRTPAESADDDEIPPPPISHDDDPDGEDEPQPVASSSKATEKAKSS